MRWRLNLTLQISQGSASTYFRWSEHLCTVLLSVYSRTCLPIFIGIGSYLTDTEQIISWHIFIETLDRHQQKNYYYYYYYCSNSTRNTDSSKTVFAYLCYSGMYGIEPYLEVKTVILTLHDFYNKVRQSVFTCVSYAEARNRYRLDVRLSVRLSHAGTLSKRLNILSCFLYHTIAHSF